MAELKELRRRTIKGLGFVIALLVPCAHASMEDPAAILSNVGLQVDSASLMEYLQSGLPQDISAPVRDSYYCEARMPYLRWALYAHCVSVLSSTKSTQAAPLLASLMVNQLPKPLLDDLYMRIAMSSLLEYSWQAWEDVAAEQLMILRAGCASALIEMDPSLAATATIKVILSEKDVVRRAITEEKSMWLYVHRYAGICTSAAKVGRYEGLDALFEILPYRPSRNDGNIPAILRYNTAVSIPLEYTMTDNQYAAAARRWKAWWAENSAMSPLPPRPKPRPQYKTVSTFESVHNYVEAAAQEVSGGDYYAPVYPDARKWLKTNASSHANELRDIADDKAEDDKVRLTAAQYYIETGDPAALNWARQRILVSKKAGKRENVLYPVRLIGFVPKSESKFKYRILRESLERDTFAASQVVSSMMNDEFIKQNLRYFFKNYSRLIQKYPHFRTNIVHYIKSNPISGDESILADCLINGTELDAIYAVAALRTRGTPVTLPKDAQYAYANWKQDPAFALKVLEYMDEETRLRETPEIVQRVSAYDAKSARAYAIAYKYFTKMHYGPVTPEATACLKKLEECVEGYWKIPIATR